MNIHVKWFGGPTAGSFRSLPCILSYPSQLRSKVLFADSPSDPARRAFLQGATPREGNRFYSDVYKHLIGSGIQESKIICTFDNRSPERRAIDYAVRIEQVIKLLKKAPRHDVIAEVRRQLKAALGSGK